MKRSYLTPLLICLLLAGCSADNADEELAEPELIVAAEQGDLGRLDLLLQQQPDPDVRDSCQWTPLMKAAHLGHKAVVQRLLLLDAQVDLADKGGYTALLLAASNNHVEIIDLLHARGANLNQQERTNGWSALIWAANMGHQASVERLLQLGADPSLRDLKGRTALDWAQLKQHQPLIPLLSAAKPATW
ncbi:MAG: ankyrin repeat domain-containing protein [Gammaproteobacteria bacterium]|nr:ankyrin repeat domain-containing protein [Gammaproteobacteria bacterium]